jgi:hypothetical protein
MSSFAATEQETTYSSYYTSLPTSAGDEDDNAATTPSLINKCEENTWRHPIIHHLGLFLKGESSGHRENKLVCGCDVRRVTIILNLIMITLEVWMIALMVVMSYIDDEHHHHHHYHHHYSFGVDSVPAVLVLAITLHSFGIYGAIKYKTWAIMVAAMAAVFPLAITFLAIRLVVMEGIPAATPEVLLFGSFGYFILSSHVLLVREIEAGVMTNYNYQNVRACFLC